MVCTGRLRDRSSRCSVARFPARSALQGEFVAVGLDDLAASIAADLHDGHGQVSSESRACDARKLLHRRTFPEHIQHPGTPLMPQPVRADILGYCGSFLGCASHRIGTTPGRPGNRPVSTPLPSPHITHRWFAPHCPPGDCIRRGEPGGPARQAASEVRGETGPPGTVFPKFHVSASESRLSIEKLIL